MNKQERSYSLCVCHAECEGFDDRALKCSGYSSPKGCKTFDFMLSLAVKDVTEHNNFGPNVEDVVNG